MRLQAFYYKTWADGSHRHVLVWGRLQDTRAWNGNEVVLPEPEAPMKIPYVYNGRVGMADPQKLVLMQCGDAQPPVEWVWAYCDYVKTKDES